MIRTLEVYCRPEVMSMLEKRPEVPTRSGMGIFGLIGAFFLLFIVIPLGTHMRWWVALLYSIGVLLVTFGTPFLASIYYDRKHKRKQARTDSSAEADGPADAAPVD